MRMILSFPPVAMTLARAQYAKELTPFEMFRDLIGLVEKIIIKNGRFDLKLIILFNEAVTESLHVYTNGYWTGLCPLLGIQIIV